MSFGMRIWGANGTLQLDENSFTVRIVYSAIVSPSGRSRFISIPEVSASTHSAVCIPVVAYDTTAQFTSAIMFTPIVGTGGVTVYFGSPAAGTGPTGTTPQRLLVMRNK
jgi:hypothetical protein